MRIHNPNVLGISFCRVRIECTRCSKFLVSELSCEKERVAKTYQPPPALSQSSSDPGDNANSCTPAHPTKESLFCQSGCSQSYAAAKWECSAIIDDGTGQAKLYADREAALLLLGDNLDTAAIEEGAWASVDGIFFKAYLPTPSHLIQCIQDATLRVNKNSSEKRETNSKIKNERTPFIKLLSAEIKAEYLLQNHCRHWYELHYHRELDFFCRCKPFPENLTSLNQTEIHVACASVADSSLEFGAVATATLPRLQLLLVDACLSSEEHRDDTLKGWKILDESSAF